MRPGSGPPHILLSLGGCNQSEEHSPSLTDKAYHPLSDGTEPQITEK